MPTGYCQHGVKGFYHFCYIVSLVASSRSQKASVLSIQIAMLNILQVLEEQQQQLELQVVHVQQQLLAQQSAAGSGTGAGEGGGPRQASAAIGLALEDAQQKGEGSALWAAHAAQLEATICDLQACTRRCWCFVCPCFCVGWVYLQAI